MAILDRTAQNLSFSGFVSLIYRYLMELLGWGVGPSQNTRRHTTPARRNVSIGRVGFERTIAVFDK